MWNIMNSIQFLESKIDNLLMLNPGLKVFFNDNYLDFKWKENLTIKDFFNSFDEKYYKDKATTKEFMAKSMYEFYILALKNQKENILSNVEEITIKAWNNKNWKLEEFSELVIKKWDIICIVWPTWSGKSRLLADIEWMAQKDTPTNREILVNWKNPDKSFRYSSENKLVAQLSQNMNFVMDLSVIDFITLHAESRWIKDIEEVVKKVIIEANLLAWEKFDNKTPITSLSWGQSRALMIADTAILSKSPIVLIDEIENAWVDRKKALNLLIKEDKIVLMATHDPTLALLWNKRIVIKDWWINKIIESSIEERKILSELEKIDKIVSEYRDKLRWWEMLHI